MEAAKRERDLWLASLGLAVVIVGSFCVPVALALGKLVAWAILRGIA